MVNFIKIVILLGFALFLMSPFLGCETQSDDGKIQSANTHLLPDGATNILDRGNGWIQFDIITITETVTETNSLVTVDTRTFLFYRSFHSSQGYCAITEIIKPKEGE